MSISSDSPPRYQFADLTLDLGQRRVWRGTEPIELGRLSFDLLRVLVEAAPSAVANDDLAAKVWGPRRIVTPENLSRRLLLLRKSLGDDSSNPRYIAGVRAYGYRLIPAVRRLSADVAVRLPVSPPAPVEAPIARHASAPVAARAAGAVAVLLLLAALVGWFAGSRVALDESPERTRKSIAVLPFADFSERRDQAYLGDGIAEDLTGILTRIPQFRVTARGSAFSFRGKDVTTAEIARTLDVRYLIEGSIRRDGDRLRIGARLVDAATDTQLWSATYPRSLGDVFQVQQEIASAVAEELRVRLLGPIAPVDTTTPEVYALFLQGQRIVRDGNVSSLPSARELLERAIAMDPGYLPARITLAYAYGDLPLSGAVDLPTAQALVTKTLADAAAIWPDRAEVNAARGVFAALFDGDLETAGGYFQRALAAEPANVAVLSAVVLYAIALNRPTTAVAVGEYVVERDPLCAVCRFSLLRAYSLAGRYADIEALYASSRALNLDTFGGFQYLRSNALLQTGAAEVALAAFGAMESHGDIMLEAGKLTGTAMALRALGQEPESETAFRQLRELVGTNGWINVAAVYANAGDLDDAFAVLSAAPSLDRGAFDWPPLSTLRSHPRWPELAAKAGLWPEDPRARIAFEVALPE